MIALLLALPAQLLRAAAKNIELVGVLIVFALMLLAYFSLTHFTSKLTDQAASAGAASAKAEIANEATTKGLSDVQAAQSAAVAVDRDHSRAIAECLRDSRTPENCH